MTLNRQSKLRADTDIFRSCFAAVASFLGRPGADAVLFSRIPLSGSALEIDEVRHMAERIGLNTRTFSHRDFLRNSFDLPAIIFRPNQPPVALLAEKNGAASFVTGVQLDGRNEIGRAELEREASMVGIAFSLSYSNASEEMRVGTAEKIEKRHWLAGTVGAFW